MPGGPGSRAWVGGPGPSPPGRKLQRRWRGGLSRHGAGEEPEGGLRSGGGGQGPRMPPVGLPARVVACCSPATIGHLQNSSGLRASDPPPRRGRAGRCSSASWTPGQRRVKDTCSLPLAPSPLESPRNDVSTRQLKKSLIIETDPGSWNKLGRSMGPVNNSGASGPGWPPPRGARAPGRGGGKLRRELEKRRKFEESAFSLKKKKKTKTKKKQT